ncbi:DUF1853 family protein [Vibrio chagasii]|nr:DUF1853 family protein [Vibrio chagasii]
MRFRLMLRTNTWRNRLYLEDTSSQKLEHWEVAIKFTYFMSKHGLVPILDQLDKKLDRMLCHQLGMSSSNAFVERVPGDRVDSKHLLMQRSPLYQPISRTKYIPTECWATALTKPSKWILVLSKSGSLDLAETLYPLNKSNGPQERMISAVNLSPEFEPLCSRAN